MKKAHIAVIILLSIILIFGISNIKKENKEINKPTENTQAEESEKLEEKFSQDANFYIVNIDKSNLSWLAKQNIIKNEHSGTVDITQGVVIYSEDKFVGGEFVIDMTSIKDNGDNEFLEKHLKGEDFFAVEKHRTAKLKLLEINKTDTEDIYRIKANLTIKKITNIVEFDASITFNNENLEAEASFDIDRTKWNVKYGSDKFFDDIGDKIIGDKIYFDIKISAQI